MNFRGFVIGIAVFILTLFVTTYGVNMFYSEPLYEDFCPNSIWQIDEVNESVCFENGGKWNFYGEKTQVNSTGWCDHDYSCREAYDLANERHSTNIFLISVPLGILLLLGGFYFFSLESIGVGLMLGGVGTMLRGIGSYWRYSEDWVRFLVSLVGLVIVIFFSYRFSDKFEKKDHNKSKK